MIVTGTCWLAKTLPSVALGGKVRTWRQGLSIQYKATGDPPFSFIQGWLNVFVSSSTPGCSQNVKKIVGLFNMSDDACMVTKKKKENSAGCQKQIQGFSCCDEPCDTARMFSQKTFLSIFCLLVLLQSPTSFRQISWTCRNNSCMHVTPLRAGKTRMFCFKKLMTTTMNFPRRQSSSLHTAFNFLLERLPKHFVFACRWLNGNLKNTRDDADLTQIQAARLSFFPIKSPWTRVTWAKDMHGHVFLAFEVLLLSQLPKRN